MITLPYEEMVEALRALIQATWLIPLKNPIIETGEGTSQEITSTNLPMAIIELDGEAVIDDDVSDITDGHSAKALTTKFNYLLWLINSTSADQDDVSRMRTNLRLMVFALLADKTLAGTISRLSLTGINWTGNGRQWPVAVEEGAGVIAGYVALKVRMTEV